MAMGRRPWREPRSSEVEATVSSRRYNRSKAQDGCIRRRKYCPAPQWAACAIAGVYACGLRLRPRRRGRSSPKAATGSAPPRRSRCGWPPGAGMLRIAVRQRGISLTASLEDATAGVTTLSPVDALRRDDASHRRARRARPIRVQIRSRDSPTSSGKPCVSAELVKARRDQDAARRRASLRGRGRRNPRAPLASRLR